MAHNKFKHDNILTTNNEGTWHNLDENIDVLNLDAVKQKIAFPVLTTPQTFLNPVSGQNMQADHKTTYRVVTNQFDQPQMIKLGEVGPAYTVLQNEDFIEAFRPIEDANLAELNTAGTLLNGVKFFMTFKLTEIEPVPGDIYRCYIVAFNTHDGSGSAGLVSTTVRVVCDNTYRAATSGEFKLTTKHTKNVKVNIDKLIEFVDWQRGGFIATQEQLKELSDITLQSEEQLKKIVRVVFSQASLEKAWQLEQIKESASVNEVIRLYNEGKGVGIYNGANHGLRLFNAITEYTNHIKGRSTATADSRLNSVLFTDGKRINDRAVEAILSVRQ